MKKPKPLKKSSPRNTLRMGILFALAVLAYVNTIPNDYAVDDVYAISRNQFTKQGLAGIDDILGKNFFAGFLGEQEIALAGGRYRPLSLVTFAIEVEVFGENPHLSHAINVLLYALLVVLLYWVFKQLIPGQSKHPWLSDLVFVTLLLYTLHPVHTEVVANIKGRDEILAFGFAVLALKAAFSWQKTPKANKLIWMLLAFFLALMSKENAVAFLIIIPASLYWSGVESPKPILSTFLWLWVPFIGFLAIRLAVLGTLNPGVSQELMDNPFVEASTNQRIGTILYTIGEYYRLMLFPHPLTWDYYPYHIPLTHFLSYKALLPLLVTLVLLVLALLSSRSRKGYAYGIWFFLVSFFLVSNVLITTGVFMAERFLFMPSFGLCLAMATIPVWLGEWKQGRFRQVTMILLIGILAAFLIKTIRRNKDWKDNFTLYTTDVKVSSNSAKGNNIAGQFYAYEANQTKEAEVKTEYQEKALYHLRRAVRIHPRYGDAWFHYGNSLYDFRADLDSLLLCYQKVIERIPEEPNVWQNLNRLVKARQGVDDRIRIRRMILQMDPRHPESLSELGRLLASQKEFSEARPLLVEALKYQPQDALAWETLGFIYYSENQLDSAQMAYRQAFSLEPSNLRYRQNMYAILNAMGKRNEAASFAP